MKVSWRRRSLWGMQLGLICALFLQANLANADLTALIGYGNGNDGGGVASTNPGPGAYTLTASGSDFWGTSDNGGFLYDPTKVSGNFTAIVRSTGFSGDALAGEWGRTGIMARVDGAAANSANIFANRKSGTLADGAIAGILQYRDAAGGGTDRQGGEFPGTPYLSGLSGNDVWLALSRNGDDWVMRYALGDGTNNVPTNWSMGRAHWTPNMGAAVDVHVGLAHQAHSIPRRNTAAFEGFAVGALDPQLGSPMSGLVNYVQQPDGTWNRIEMYMPNRIYNDAKAIAASMSYGGAPGHLATPRSLVENFTMNGLQYAGNGDNWQRSWIGLDDTAVEGDWALQDNGQVIWQGLGSGAGGLPVGGAYTQWNGTGEPNNAGALGEDAAEMLSGSALWNDNATTGTMRSSIVEFETALASKPALPGPNGGVGTFGVRMFRGTNYNFNNVLGVEALAYGVGENPGLVREVIDSQQPMINFQNDNNDPHTPGSVPFPGIPQVSNNFAMLAKGTIQITEEDDYTFAFRSDDGAMLRIHGATFFDSATPAHTWSNINGGKAHLGNLAMFSAPTGDTNTKAVAHLTPGVYGIEYMMYENGGGGHTELVAARGNRIGEDSNNNPNFRPIGAPAQGPTITPATVIAPFASAQAGSDIPGWDVVRKNGPNSIAAAIPAIEAIFADPLGQPNDGYEVRDTINYYDPEGGGGSIGVPQVPFPGNTPAAEDNFAIGAVTVLTANQTGTYRFTVLGDDGSQFRLQGSAGWTAGGIAAVDAFGDGIYIASCCSDGFGEVFLNAGEQYVAQLIWNEIGGGAYVSVRYSINGQGNFLLGSSADGSRQAGLQLVPEPSSFALAGFGAIGLLAAIRRRRRNA